MTFFSYVNRLSPFRGNFSMNVVGIGFFDLTNEGIFFIKINSLAYVIFC